jgi:hypothetical protein
MKVPDGARGNTRCPKCGAIFPIPDGGPSPLPPPVQKPAFEVVEGAPGPGGSPPTRAPKPAASSDAAPPARARTKAAVDEDEDEEDTKPKKRAAVDDEDEEDKKPKKRAAVDDEDEPRKKKQKKKRFEDDEDEDERPRRKTKKSRGGGGVLWLLLGLFGLLGLALVGLLVWLLWPSGPDAYVRYLPDNTQFVAAVNVEELLNSKAYKQLSDEFPKVEKDLDLEGEFGLSLKDISSVVIGGNPGSGKQELVVVVRTTRAVKASDLTSKAKNGKFNSETVGSYTVYTRGKDALCVPESKLILLGEAETLKKVLKRDRAPELSPGMKAALKETDFSKTIAVAADLKGLVGKSGGRQGNNAMGGLPFSGGADEILKNAEGVGGWVSVKSDIAWKITVIFKDSTSASDAKKLFDGAIVSLKNARNVPSEASELIDGMDIKAIGNRVEIRGGIDVSKLLKLVKSAKSGKF